MDKLDSQNVNTSPLTARFLRRPRIDRIFDQLTNCKLVYVIAGSGYGKTRAVRSYFDKQPDAAVRWLRLTESDNIGSRFWEGIAHSISYDNPELAFKLREIGFPDTNSRFKQFTDILRSADKRSKKSVLVLDDFHLIRSEQALAFAERCAYLPIPGECIVIISRKEPEINAMSLFSRNMAGMITEDELRFTENEISAFFKQCKISFSSEDLPRLIGVTEGWALAVNLLTLVLKRIPKDLDYALDTMKKNIFKLFETEEWGGFPENVQKAMVKLSLVSDLPITPLREVFGDARVMQYAPLLSSFIWFDSLAGDYRVHPLYLEFIQSKNYILSDHEKQDTYRRAARWCYDNKFYTDAVNYYALSRQYDRILKVLLSLPVKLPPDTCEYFLGILEGIDPGGAEKDDNNILLLKNLFIPLLYVGMGKYVQAREQSLDIIRKWEGSDMPIAPSLLYTAYSNLAYIDTYACTVTHKYDFAEHMRKAIEYYKQSTIPLVKMTEAFSVADIRSFVCLVGEGASLPEFDQFLSTTREASKYIEETHHHMYYGYDDLVACELEFNMNRLESARNSAHNAILKARERNQYSIEAMAQYHLLRIAIHGGDYPLTKELLRQIYVHLDNPMFWNRKVFCDLFTGSFFCHIGLPEMVPSWLVLDEKDTASEVSIPARELIVGVRCFFALGKFNQALAVLCNSSPRDPHERFYFGELIFSLLLSYARFKTGDIVGAGKDFITAYKASFDGVFEMPFVELGKAFPTLASAALEHGNYDIPDQWLARLSRKASVYAKKSAIIANSFKSEKKVNKPIHLSDREQEVLNDLYHGLSRDEIATHRYLSVNTVKKVLQSIYIKLDANNNVDAIRIAIEKKLAI